MDKMVESLKIREKNAPKALRDGAPVGIFGLLKAHVFGWINFLKRVNSFLNWRWSCKASVSSIIEFRFHWRLLFLQLTARGIYHLQAMFRVLCIGLLGYNATRGKILFDLSEDCRAYRIRCRFFQLCLTALITTSLHSWMSFFSLCNIPSLSIILSGSFSFFLIGSLILISVSLLASGHSPSSIWRCFFCSFSPNSELMLVLYKFCQCFPQCRRCHPGGCLRCVLAEQGAYFILDSGARSDVLVWRLDRFVALKFLWRPPLAKSHQRFFWCRGRCQWW